MSSIAALAQEFLQQKCIAVSGVSRTRDDAANLIYRNLKARGYRVYAVNPNTDSFDGDPCFPDLASLPEKPDGVVVVNRSEVAVRVLEECAVLGITRVWTHCSLGSKPWPFVRETASKLGLASPQMVAFARQHGITLIPGACPNMFIDNPPDRAHRFMRGMLRITGALKD